MYDYSRGSPSPYVDYRTDVALADRPAVLGKVMGLLGFAFLFTAGGAVIGRSLGPGAFLLYIGISAVAAVLFTGFLVFDLNRVANSRGATEGQAILLAVSVYLDIFNLFLALLRLFGFAGSSRD